MITVTPDAGAVRSKEWERLIAHRGGAFSRGGFSLVEVVVAMTISILMGAAIIMSLMASQRFAAKARLLTNARVIVQRNIEAATGVIFTGTSSTPAILALTGDAGVVCDDDGGSGAPVENIQVLRGTNNVLVTGTLRRIVTAEPVVVSGTEVNSSVVVRRITFQIDYDYLSHHYTHSETTLRSADAQ